MWYDTQEDYWLNTESALWERLKEIAENHKESFNPDELIDEMCKPAEYFGVVFSPCRIIRTLDNELYKEIYNNLMDNWIDETMYDIDRLCPSDGDTLNNYLLDYFRDERLEKIVWRDEDED